MQPKESDSRYHFILSMVKSVLRIIGFIGLLFKDFELTAVLLLAAEVVGIAEEL